MGTCLDRGRIPVGDTQEICSTLVRPGAGLTTELFHSSRSETFDSSSNAGGGEEMCSNLTRPEARWIHIWHFQLSHDTNFAASRAPSNETCVGLFSYVLNHIR